MKIYTEPTVLSFLLAEVQIGINLVGLCGSDIHYWTYGRNGDNVLREPVIPGHEASGTVTKLGKGVKNLRIGKDCILDIKKNTSNEYECNGIAS